MKVYELKFVENGQDGAVEARLTFLYNYEADDASPHAVQILDGEGKVIAFLKERGNKSTQRLSICGKMESVVISSRGAQCSPRVQILGYYPEYEVHRTSRGLVLKKSRTFRKDCVRLSVPSWGIKTSTMTVDSVMATHVLEYLSKKYMFCIMIYGGRLHVTWHCLKEVKK